MIKNITYEDKIAIQNDESVDRKNKVTDADMNEIKEVVNANADEQTTQNTDISNIKKEQEKQNTNIEENNSKIVELQNEKAELEKELKEAQEDFYQNSIRGQASGEYIHVEDSSNCRAKIGISGNHEQETRSGKNKIEITKTTTTVNGCTHTIKDGTDTLSGTSTGWANLIIYSFTGNGKTYTLSGSPQSSKNIFISAHDNTQNKDLVTSKNGNAGTFVATSGNSIDIIICVAPNLTLANELFKPQLEEGSTVTEWEQYGAMPSLGYPSQIKAVGSNVNLANKDNITNLYFNQNQISVGSTSKTMIENCLPNTTYTISKIKSTKFRVCTTNKTPQTNESIIDYTYNDNGDKITITTSDKAKYMCIYYYDSGTDTLEEQGILDSIKIEKGKVATPWSPCGQGCVKVTKCNKNIYNKNEEIICNGVGIGANGELFSRSDQKLLIIPISKLETNIAISFTKTFSYNLRYAFSDTIVENINSEIFDTDYIENFTTTNIKVNKIIQNNKHNYLLLGFTNKDSYSDLQVEYSKVVTSFEQHEEQSYIMPTQQPMMDDDYFDRENNEEVHTWQKIVLDGSSDENWAIQNNRYFACTTSKETGKFHDKWFAQVIGPTSLQYAKSNIGVIDYSILDWGTGFGLALAYGVRINLENIDALKGGTVEQLRAYLAENPITIYVKLKDSAYEKLPCTSEQTEILDELNNARTYKNVTNITTDSKAILSLDYAKDLETLLNNTQALAVNNASEGV